MLLQLYSLAGPTATNPQRPPLAPSKWCVDSTCVSVLESGCFFYFLQYFIGHLCAFIMVTLGRVDRKQNGERDGGGGDTQKGLRLCGMRLNQ